MPTSRLKLLFEKLELSRLDAILVSSAANVSYLSHFKNSESYLLISLKKSLFITDFRYTQEAKESIQGFTIFRYKNLFKDIAFLSNKFKIKRLGFEAKHLSFAEYERIANNLNKIKFIPTFNIIENLRRVKDEEELKYIRVALKITKKTFEFLKKYLKSGLTELQITAEIERFIRKEGAQETAFNTIVASGPNSSFPHATASSRKIRSEEPIVVDLGVRVQEGYKSDLTRVFFLDKITPIQRRIYQLVEKAQNEAIKQIKPGAAFNEIDRAAAEVISQGGYGKYFGHSTGHGVGLEVHEEPSVSFRNKSLCLKNMVFTIEPGIYLPGKFGMRLEDMVLVTDKGVEVLSGAIDKSI